MEQDRIQIVKAYPDREEIKGFLSSYIIVPLSTFDSEQTYKIEYKIPTYWFILICLVFPGLMLFVLPTPQLLKIIFLSMAALMIPAFLILFKKLFLDKLKPVKVRLIYDKAENILHLPVWNLNIPRADIKEFSVIYGWLEQKDQKALIAELSVIFEDQDEVKRIPLFLGSKSVCCRIAEKLSEYTGEDNYFMKV